MSTYYIPYRDNEPSAVNVKGHRLLFIVTQVEDILDCLPLLGSPRIKSVDYTGDENEMMALLAEETGGGVILAPPGMSVKSMVEELESELPWLQ